MGELVTVTGFVRAPVEPYFNPMSLICPLEHCLNGWMLYPHIWALFDTKQYASKEMA